MNDLELKTREAFDQLARYGGGVENEDVFNVLWKLSDINDDIANGRDANLVREGCNEAKRLLDKLAEAYEQS